MSVTNPDPQPQPQPQPHTLPVRAQETGSRRRLPRWATYGGAALLAFLIGWGAGGGQSSPTAAVTSPAASPAAVDVTTSPEYLALVTERDKAVADKGIAERSLATVTAQRDAAVAVAAAVPAAPPASGITTGQYIVGTDLEPGRYSMVATGSTGYVDQQNGKTYLAQEVAPNGDRIIVDIANVPGSIVTFRDVTNIKKVG